jgi:plastocyanin
MNTRKQVLLMSALLLVALIVVGVYGAWYPYREVDAEAHFEELTAERGSILFALNCRICHGNLGEGGSLGARLPAAPALDRADLQGFIDSTATLAANVNATDTTIRVSNAARFQGGQTILVEDERMEVRGINGNELSVKRATGHHSEAMPHASGAQVQILDAQTLADSSTLIENTIACGRVGTAMPIWGQDHGGPLSDEQIRQLMVMITQDRWDLVEEHINLPETARPVPGDRTAARLLQPVAAGDAFLNVSDTSLFTAGEALRMGEERLRITSVPDLPDGIREPGQIRVERGALGTVPLDHGQEEFIYRFAEAPTDPATTPSSCGQIARAPAPAGTPELIEDFEGQSVTLVAQNIAFDTRQITVQSGGRVRIRLDNRDAVQHNVAVYVSSTSTTPASPGSVGLTFTGPAMDDTVFDTPAAGSYFFRCDVHPTTMTGTFTVQ